jgi:transmembrane sensor
MVEKINNQYSDDMGFNNLTIEQKILKHTARFKVPSGLSGEEALSMLKEKIVQKEGSINLPQKGNIKLVYWLSSIAAAMLMLIGIWQVWFNNPDTKVIAGMGSHTECQLPDGSQISLNADSRITYNKKNFKESRNLKFDGEAFFEVTKGKDFIISTSYADIKVLGTSFNVYSRDNSFKVSCHTGKILVSSNNQSVTIIPGESAMFSGDNLISHKDKNLSTSASWLKGEFYFENAPLNLIFNEIERQFNVKFAGQKMDEKYFTGSFTNKNLGNALEIVCIPMGLSYEIGSDGKILISEGTQ